MKGGQKRQGRKARIKIREIRDSRKEKWEEEWGSDHPPTAVSWVKNVGKAKKETF